MKNLPREEKKKKGEEEEENLWTRNRKKIHLIYILIDDTFGPEVKMDLIFQGFFLFIFFYWKANIPTLHMHI